MGVDERIADSVCGIVVAHGEAEPDCAVETLPDGDAAGDAVKASTVAVHDGVAGFVSRKDLLDVGDELAADVGSASCASARPRKARPSLGAVVTGRSGAPGKVPSPVQ